MGQTDCLTQDEKGQWGLCQAREAGGVEVTGVLMGSSQDGFPEKVVVEVLQVEEMCIGQQSKSQAGMKLRGRARCS